MWIFRNKNKKFLIFSQIRTKKFNVFRQLLDGKELPRHSRMANYTDVNGDEMQVFMALWIAFGLVHKHDLSHYWSTDAVTSTPFFSSQMSRNRFEQILTVLHLNNNDNHVPRGEDDHDALFKVRPIYDLLRNKFR